MFDYLESAGRRGQRAALRRLLAFPVRFVDLTVTATSVTAGSGATIENGIAGVTITAGQAVYKNASDADRLALADADLSVLAAACVGIALNGGAIGQPIRYLTSGIINIGATVTVGHVYLVSSTAGGIQPHGDISAGEFSCILGIGFTTAQIKVQIQQGGVSV